MQTLTVDGLEIKFELGKMLNVEVIALTKVTGVPFSEFGEKLKAFDFEAMTALVWILRKRTEPTLRYDEVTFPIDSLSMGDDDPEEPTAPVVDPKDEQPSPPTLEPLTI